MNLFGVLDINSSALTAERERAEVTASNMANAETTHTTAGGPYKKQLVVFGTERANRGKFALTLARLEICTRGECEWKKWFRTRPLLCAGTNPATRMRTPTGMFPIRTLIRWKRWST